MDTQNLARWIDEIQGQIDMLKLKVSGAGSGDTITPLLTVGDQIATINTDTALYAKVAKAPFIDLDNMSEGYEISGTASYVATEDCAVAMIRIVSAAIADAASEPTKVARVFLLDGTTAGDCIAYLKKGQRINMTGAALGSSYSVIPLLEATQPTAPEPTPDVAQAADTRSTKKKK